MAWQYLKRSVTYQYSFPAVQRCRIDDTRRLLQRLTAVGGKVVKEELFAVRMTDDHQSISEDGFKKLAVTIRTKSEPDPEGERIFTAREHEQAEALRRKKRRNR